jgi:ABC-type anion transport system duplicated permease subunit
MMSVAGGWFFLMACEMFVLGNRDFRLPGLGSYLQTAANAGDALAMVWGITAMIGVIVMIDWMIWKPLAAWADKFKFEDVESVPVERPAGFDVIPPIKDCRRHEAKSCKAADGTPDSIFCSP